MSDYDLSKRFQFDLALVTTASEVKEEIRQLIEVGDLPGLRVALAVLAELRRQVHDREMDRLMQGLR